MSDFDNAEIIRELAKCIELYASGEESIGAESLISLARAVYRNRKDSAAVDESGKSVASMRREAAKRLFVYWQEQCGHKRARPTADRQRAIIARLTDGYTEADIKRAIDGAAANAFTSEDGRRFDDLTLICRNGSKLESFIARSGEEVSAANSAEAEDPIANVRREMARAHSVGDRVLYDVLKEKLRRLEQ